MITTENLTEAEVQALKPAIYLQMRIILVVVFVTSLALLLKYYFHIPMETDFKSFPALEIWFLVSLALSAYVFSHLKKISIHKQKAIIEAEFLSYSFLSIGSRQKIIKISVNGKMQRHSASFTTEERNNFYINMLKNLAPYDRIRIKKYNDIMLDIILEIEKI